ncbi:DUF3219 family protein [Aquibacillus rhizosphaerae]|uniref:DUF3219 family protein n=1 Tax=Aquibacillus rhizosphaerae TaxID=3051431 RepID=A0ABT7L1R7_9BACI|nr:DUF3219 family protein [Aquibacillus sp. LR5S19]MDL4839790.1 DUF3219 family protein [Aquibacillus sp. LR5S19]
MVKELILNKTILHVDNFEETKVNGLLKISFAFKVIHEEYHDITTLLYEGVFDVIIPEKKLSFRGEIQNYSTSITNLYQKGSIGDFQLTLLEKA